MAAQVIRHKRYYQDIPFFMVECDECLIVCNSGHQYRLDQHDLAAAEAKRHNETEHK